MHSIQNIQSDLNSKKISSLELVKNSLNQIQKTQDSRAYLAVFEQSALKQAEASDKKRQLGQPLGALEGIPIAIKDNIVTKEGTTTCGSKILENFHSPYDATVISKLTQAGAIIVGKTNCDEFAMGSSNENSAYGAVTNPLNPQYIPGGSSGGSAAAVAAHTVPLALGSDTGGSIRQPAACCGIVGLKPTYGRVSRYGLVAYASSLDQIGPMAHTVHDVAALLEVISGEDPYDQTSSHKPVGAYIQSLEKFAQPRKIGIPQEYFEAKNLNPQIKNSLQNLLKQMELEGNQLVPIQLPHMEFGVAAYYILSTAEASSNLSRFDGVRYSHRAKEVTSLGDMYTKSRGEGFGWEVKKRILLGTYVLSSGFYDAYYMQAQKLRRKITQDFERAFQACDVICTPTMPSLPPKLGELVKNPMEAYLGDIFTVGVNLAGLPAISVPLGEIENNLRPGVQFIGRPFDEETLLQVAKKVEVYSK